MPLPTQRAALLLLAVSKVSCLSQTAIPSWLRGQAWSAVGNASRAAVRLPLQLHFMWPLTDSVMHACTASCAASLPACHIPLASVAELIHMHSCSPAETNKAPSIYRHGTRQCQLLSDCA